MPNRPTCFALRLALGLSAALLLTATAGQAADFAAGVQPAPPPVEGIDCAGVPGVAWESVWLGHFSGGESAYDPEAGKISLRWVDQKLCFPSREACNGWVAPLRQAFHRPESYWTCLPLR